MKKLNILFLFLIFGNALAQKPNILMIVAEDMSPHLGCYGDMLVKTPNIDKLAKEGLRFTNMYSTAGVCAPSRSSIITGMYQTSIGTHNMRTLNPASKPVGVTAYQRVIPENVKAYTEYLRMAGYYCTNNAKTDYQFETPTMAWDDCSKKGHWRNKSNKDQPFFSVFNLEVTHESQVWGRANKPLEIEPSNVIVPFYLPDVPEVRADIARFLSNVNEMDRQVGQIIEQLKEDGLYDKTIIMFYSDHGDGLPYVKREITQRGLHVPFIIRYPEGKNGGSLDQDLHSFVDIAPTMLSIAGQPIPSYIQGVSFFGTNKVARKYVFGARDRMDEVYDRVRSVRDNRFQYLKNYFPEKPYYIPVKYRTQQKSMAKILEMKDLGQLNAVQMAWFLPKNTEEELYDLEADPEQRINLLNNTKYASKLQELRKALADWQKKYGDMGAIAEIKMIEKQLLSNG
jgi:N-sulfoglucosamine sulfohydrolase